MLSKIKFFKLSEHGAITVDWVVLCAAVAGLAVLIILSTTEGTIGLANATKSAMSDGI